MKKANKGHEGQTKGQRIIYARFSWILGVLESLRVFYLQDFVFWCFEVKKAKKAATQDQMAKSQRSK